MGSQIGLGILLALLGGALNGSFPAPMKRMPGWRWENSWLIYSVAGLILIPWLIALATVPHLASVYQQASWSVLTKVCLYGFAWGVGSVLIGLGMSWVGVALGFSVVLSITATFGSLLPLAVLHPEQMGTHRGVGLMAGTLVAIVGLVLVSIAGKRREQEQNPGPATPGRHSFAAGLIVCVFSGLFSSMLNFAFIFGDELKRYTLAAGASSSMAGNAVWLLAVGTGFIANAAYCIYLLNKNHTWGIFLSREAGAGYWLGGALMGGLWFGGLVVYGMGAAMLGVLGGMIGWPLYMIMAIVAGLFLGFISGEWKGTSRGSYGYALAGVAILFLAIGVIAWGNAA